MIAVAAVLSACNGCGQGAIFVEVQVDPALGAGCVQVAALPASGDPQRTAPMPTAGKSELKVAIFQTPALGASIGVRAQGFASSDCSGAVLAEDARDAVAFVKDAPVQVLLQLGASGSVDGGTDGGQLPGDDGGTDAGEDAGVDGGADAGCSCTPSGECFAATCQPGGGCAEVVAVGASCQGRGVCLADAGCLQDFEYVPANFPTDEHRPQVGGIFLNCGVTRIDTTPGANPVLTNWCPGQPVPQLQLQTQVSGPDAVVLSTTELFVGDAGVLEVVGSRPLVLAVYGNAAVSGLVYAGANGTTPGPGGSLTTYCTTARGGSGTSTGQYPGSGAGGGGAGFGTPGAPGGPGQLLSGSTVVQSLAGGVPGGTVSDTLSPLRGGCPGGFGGASSGSVFTLGGIGGGGGGALQLSVSRTLRVGGTLSASGGGGVGGKYTTAGGAGAGGGGSGGALLLEADDLQVLASGKLSANGGGGGQGGGTGFDGGSGDDGYNDDTSNAQGGSGGTTIGGPGGVGGALTPPTAGHDGGSTAVTGSGSNRFSDLGGGGGGGGAAGVIRLRPTSACVRDPAAVISPQPVGNFQDGGCP